MKRSANSAFAGEVNSVFRYLPIAVIKSKEPKCKWGWYESFNLIYSSTSDRSHRHYNKSHSSSLLTKHTRHNKTSITSLTCEVLANCVSILCVQWKWTASANLFSKNQSSKSLFVVAQCKHELARNTYDALSRMKTRVKLDHNSFTLTYSMINIW